MQEWSDTWPIFRYDKADFYELLELVLFSVCGGNKKVHAFI